MYNILNTTIIASTKLNRQPWNEFLLSVFGGIMISFGCLVLIFIKSDTPMFSSISAFLGGFIFSIGLYSVFRLRLELFVSNVVVYAVVLEKRASFSKFLKLLCLNLIGNVIGCFIVSLLFIPCNLSYIHTLQSIAQTKVCIPPLVMFFRSVLCGMIFVVFTIIHQGSTKSSSKFLAALCISILLVACSLEFSTSNAFFMLTGLLCNVQAPTPMITQGFVSFIFSVIGNLFGGLIVSSLYFAVNNYNRILGEFD